MTSHDAYFAELEAWKARRLERLTAPDGWLTIVGRFWLEPGTVSVGQAEDNDLVITAGPAHLGRLTQEESGVVTFTPAGGGSPARLVPDPENSPRIAVNGLIVEITTLEGRNALRVRDTHSSAPASFPGIPYYPPRPEWRIVADWRRLDAPIVMTVDTVVGIPSTVTITHEAIFTHAGARYALIATHGTPERPQFVIRDLTSRDETYPASRFLFGEDVTKASIVLDFNKAINPPCAFTEHAICPLPPPRNVLAFRIEAGEKRAAWTAHGAAPGGA